MCMFTLSAFRVTKRGPGSPLAEPADWARAATIPLAAADAATIITTRARLTCVMRNANEPVRSDGSRPGAFVLKHPSDREGFGPMDLPHPHRDGPPASLAWPG